MLVTGIRNLVENRSKELDPWEHRSENMRSTRGQHETFRNGTPRPAPRTYDLANAKATLARQGGYTLFGSDKAQAAQQSIAEPTAGPVMGEAAILEHLRRNYGLALQSKIEIIDNPFYITMPGLTFRMESLSALLLTLRT